VTPNEVPVASKFTLSQPITDKDHVKGPENATVTIVEYGDYECLYCGQAEYVMEEIQDRGIGEIRFVFRHFPNRLVHPRARLAAEAAEAAGTQGKFWEMHRLLFENQEHLEREHLLEYAAALDLDLERFTQELDEHVHADRIRSDFRSGVASGVRGTPTWFINGVRYDGAWDAESLLELIRKPMGMRIAEIGQAFTRMAASGGLMILLFSALALLWANSGLSDLYHQIWNLDLGIELGSFRLNEHLLHWVNDGLMAIFFLIVGLEIKRELTEGELDSRRKATLPMVAALGGMVAPVLFYVLINIGDPASLRGWGIPMATDIAFALAILIALGGRVPLSLKVFFTAMAIVDDIGAIVVLGIFYASDLNLVALGFAALILLALLLLNRWRVFSPIPYSILGIGLWLAFELGGLHPTIAGVLLALLIPRREHPSLERLLAQADTVLHRYSYEEAVEEDRNMAIIDTLQTIVRRLEPPAERLEHSLHPWTTYLILPLFALANAGVSLGDSLSDMLEPVSLGIILGLGLGKPLGISLFSFVAIRMGVAELPRGVAWPQFISASFLAGIGFTVSLFFTSAAFEDPALLASAKLGILAASLLSAVLGYVALRVTSPSYEGTSTIGQEPAAAA
ncbi:MAG: Na+/H+ antiporter NhaA, partial [Anaerolineales bacterium]